MSDQGSVDFEALTHLEQSAFERGFRGGFEHGAAHGRADGGPLGAAHGFSVWAELGYYEGLAEIWKRRLLAGTEGGEEVPTSRRQAKQTTQIGKFLELINQFPMENHSASEPPPAGLADDPEQVQTHQDQHQDIPPEPYAEDEPDISQLLARIRAKYRQLARGLGISAPVYAFAPEEAFAAASSRTSTDSSGPALSAVAQAGGVDPAQLRY